MTSFQNHCFLKSGLFPTIGKPIGYNISDEFSIYANKMISLIFIFITLLGLHILFL